MGDAMSTIQGRALGEELRRLREERGLTGTDVARMLGWDQSKVCRMELGKVRYREQDLIAYLAVCRVIGADRQRLLAMAARANEPDLLQRQTEDEETRVKIYLRHEWAATRIVNYEPLLIPGLLQTAGYARGGALACGVPPDRAEEITAAKLQRQHVLRGEYPTPAVFLIHEHALRCAFDDPTIMTDQLLHLVFMSSRPHVTIRVVPAALGLKAPTYPFVLMDLPEHRAVVYLESAMASAFLEQRKDIENCRKLWRRLDKLALGEAESRVFLAGLANGPMPPERTPDDLPPFYVAEE